MDYLDKISEKLPTQALPLFIEDVPGGCLVECGECGQEQVMEDTCSGCGKTFVYCTWWSW